MFIELQHLVVWKRYLFLSLLLAGAVLLIGCGGEPSGTVSGKLEVNGEGYSDADLCLINPESGYATSTSLESDGTFAIEDPIPVGTYTAYLAPSSGGEEETEEQPGPVAMQGSDDVDQKYWSESTSDLTVEVNEGPNEGVVLSIE
jgi:hypothetical protein